MDAMDPKEPFRLKLFEIASNLSEENLESFKFLCANFIPEGVAEKIKTPEQLFQELERREKVAPLRLDFLQKCLEKVGRADLASELKIYQCQERGSEAGKGNAESVSASVVTGSCTSLNTTEEAECYNNRGKVEFKEGRYENACRQYTHALECIPTDQDKEKRFKYLINRAACYLKMRKFQDAHLDCDSALLIDPDNEKARYRLAKAFDGEGRIAEAFMEVTSLYQKNKQSSIIADLESSLRTKIEEAKAKATDKQGEGSGSFLKSDYDVAIAKFSEGIMLLPQIPMYTKEMMNLYWQRAQCHLRKNNFEAAIRDCDEAGRLYPKNNLVLLTKMHALEGLGKYRECYNVCNLLIDNKCEVEEAEETIKRLLPKIFIDCPPHNIGTHRDDEGSGPIDGENKEFKKNEERGCSEGAYSTNAETSNLKKSKGAKKKKKKKKNRANTLVNTSGDDNVVCSKNGQSSHLLQGGKAINQPGEDYVEEMVPQTEETFNNHSATESIEVEKTELTRSGSTALLEEDHFHLTKEDYAQTKETSQFASRGSGLHETERKIHIDETVPSVLSSVKPTFPESLAGTTAANIQVNTSGDYSNVVCSNNDQSSHLLQSGKAINQPGEGYVEEMVPQTEVTFNNQSATESIEVEKTELTRSGSAALLEEDPFHLTKEDYAQTKETSQFASRGSGLHETEGKKHLDETVPSVLSSVKPSFPESLAGEAYPRRILHICSRWSCWHLSVCSVNRQLCRSFAKVKGIEVACLVLDSTEQERTAATRDGVNLIKAEPQPGICAGDEQLLLLHDDFPFTAELVIGHGMASGAAAAIQAKRFNCKRLHIFHNLPGKNEDCHTGEVSMEREETERDLGLSADFVAGIGPFVVEQWKAILNREVFTIIPGMPDVAPRNPIMTPQSRCLILGNMNNPTMNGLDLAAAALVDCRQRETSINLTVMGTRQEKVQDLKKKLMDDLYPSRVDVVVKPIDVSRKTLGIEVRGASLVLMPSPLDGFGIVALEALAAKVPILISSSCGLAKLIQTQFGRPFLKLLCTTGDKKDRLEAWSSAIDEMLDNREEMFKMAESLCEKWSSKFTWDSAADKLLRHLSSSGDFSVLSPSATTKMTLPSQCSPSALTFMEQEVDLLNKRRKHVLILSPEDNKKFPFIKSFSKVPWAAVLDFDVNSDATGYLASCENFCESNGMKICRILPPSPEEDRKSISVSLPNGIPWVLLEGIPESKRNIMQSLWWISDFFLTLGRTYPVPITFLVLWRPMEETEMLCRKLSNMLTTVLASPLYAQVKLVIASTGNSGKDVNSHLQYIAKDWSVEIQAIGLEDVCNALCQSISSSPFIQENQDFSLPAADPEDPQKVTFKVLPPSSRWISAEMEVLFQSVGNIPQFETDDACHFYRGGLISWYALAMGYAVERVNWMALKGKVDELLMTAGTLRMKMPHQRGAGGSTSARKILFDYHDKYPCVLLKSVSQSEIFPAIKVLADFCKLPVIILSDCKQVQSDEFDVDTLYNSLSNDRIPCVILEVIHQSQKKKERSYSVGLEKWEKNVPVRLADALNSEEAQGFVEIYSMQRREKLNSLRDLLRDSRRELQIPFYYALTTFEDRFTGLVPFVGDCLQGLDSREQKVLLFLAIAFHYGHTALSTNEFAKLLHAPRREMISLEHVLPDLCRELLLEEENKWRPRHDLIAVEMLRQLITLPTDGSPPIHSDNWKSLLADRAIEFFTHMSETVVNDVLLSRIPDDTSHQYISFSQLISDIPFEEDAIKLFQKAISLFPDNPYFKVHLGRFYSIKMKSSGFSLAIKYTDEGISCSYNYSRLTRAQFTQMKGIVYSRQVNCLVEEKAEITAIIEMADEGVKNFRRAVSIAPDFVDGYIPEVRMMCKVFEYINQKTGSFYEYVESRSAHPFIIDAISETSNTLECVPDCDDYAHWRMRLACLGWRNPPRGQEAASKQVEKTLKLLYHLRDSGRASRGSINRQIVIMEIDKCSKEGGHLSSIACEMMSLLDEALKFDPNNIEQTMRLWVKLAPFIPVDLSESERKVFYWCSKEKSVRSYLYKYIIAFLHLLEGSLCNYAEIMKSAKDDLNSAIKAINRPDVGRCRHPDRPVVWLAREGKGMKHLVYLDDNTELKYVRTKRFIDSKYTKQLRPLTGVIVKAGPTVGTIRVSEELEVSFRADLCETPLVSSAFNNRKVRFFLAFTFFGSDAYNVRLVS